MDLCLVVLRNETAFSFLLINLTEASYPVVWVPSLTKKALHARFNSKVPVWRFDTDSVTVEPRLTLFRYTQPQNQRCEDCDITITVIAIYINRGSVCYVCSREFFWTLCNLENPFPGGGSWFAGTREAWGSDVGFIVVVFGCIFTASCKTVWEGVAGGWCVQGQPLGLWVLSTPCAPS